jgi:hypothetical protein
MSPYGEQYPKTVGYALTTADGSTFGKVTFQLLATPTLQRPSVNVFQAKGWPEMKLETGEGPTGLVLNVAGVGRNIVSDLKGQDDYLSMVTQRSDDSVRKFCTTARQYLNDNLQLTVLDRSLAMHQALFDADRSSARGPWYRQCFDADETLALRTASDIYAPPPPTPVADVPAAVSEEVKWALGCQITGYTGSDCSAHASNRLAVLNNAFADNVQVGQMDFADLVDLQTIDPSTRKIGRDQLIAALASKAGTFCCFSRGLYVGVNGDTRAYKFLFTVDAGKISAVQTIAISPAELKR